MAQSSDRNDLIRTLLDLAKQGQREYAEKELDYLVRAEPGNAAAWLALAQVSSTRQKAVYCLEQVVRLQPDNQGVAQALIRLKRAPSRARQTVVAKRRTMNIPMLALGGMALILCLILAGSGLALMNGSPLIAGANPTEAVALVVATETPTLTPSHTPTQTATYTPTATFTPSVTPTATSTVTPRPTMTPQPTSTPRPTREPGSEDSSGSDSDDEAPPVFGPTTTPLYTSTPWPDVDGLVIEKDVEYYNVTGNTLDELQASLYASGLHTPGGDAWASTESQFNFNYTSRQTANGCTLATVKVTLNLIYTYPRWKPSGEPTADTLYEWDRFIRELLRHEEHHGQISYETGQQFLTELRALPDAESCSALEEMLSDTVDEVSAAGNARQDAFDVSEGGLPFPVP
jgi:predicted secreted Zn-dependent protease